MRYLDRCYEIERTAYEGDEAATRGKIATRIHQYPQGFVVLERKGEVIGFINSGCADEVVMADEAFKELVGHNPAAPNVVIMSVVIAPEQQGQGYSTHPDAPLRRAGRKGRQAQHPPHVPRAPHRALPEIRLSLRTAVSIGPRRDDLA